MDQQIDSASNELVQQLSQKIREQAQRLSSLEQYKLICETRIKQLIPDHPLPVKQQHITENVGKLSQRSQKDLESQSASKRIETENQLEQQQKQTSQFLIESEDFPHPSKLSNYEAAYILGAYQSLYSAFNLIMKDKNNLEKSLRSEILNNEEQRTYIEVLRQALEKSIQESGLGFFIHKYGKESSDIFAQISNMKQSNDLYKAECQKIAQNNQHLMQELQSMQEKISTLQKEKETFIYSKTDTNTELERASQALTLAKQQVEQLESEKQSLLSYCDECIEKEKQLLEQLSKLKQEILQFKEKEIKMAKETEELTTMVQESQTEVYQKEQIIEELETTKANYEDQIEKQDQKNSELQQEISQLQLQQEQNAKKLDKTKQELQQKIQDFEILEKKLSLIQENNDLTAKENKKENELLSRQLEELQQTNEQLNKIIEEQKITSQTQSQSYEEKIEEYIKKFQRETREKIKLESQLQQQISNNTKLQQSFQQQDHDLQKVIQENELLRKKSIQLETDYQSVAQQKDAQQKQLIDMCSNSSVQQKHYQQSQRDFASFKNVKEDEIENLHHQKSDLEQENQRLRKQMINESNILQLQIDQLNQKISQQSRELYNSSLDIEKSQKSYLELQNVQHQTQSLLKEKDQSINELRKENKLLQKMAGQYKHMESQLLNIESEKSQLVQSYGEIKIQADFRQDQFQSLNEKYEIQMQEISQLQYDQAVKEEQIQQLVNQLNQLQENQKNQQSKIDSLKAKLMSRKQRTNQLKQQNESLQLELHNITISYDLVCEENKSADTQMKEMQRHLTQSQNSCKIQEEILSQIQTQYQQFIEQNQKELKQLSKSSEIKDYQQIPQFIHDLVYQINGLKNKLGKSDEIIINHDHQIQLIENQIDTITQQNKHLIEKNAILETQLESLQKEYQQLLIQHQEIIQIQSDYQQEFESSSKELQQSHQINNQLKNEIEVLRDKLSQLQYEFENQICGQKADQQQIVLLDQKIKQIANEKKQLQNLFYKCCSFVSSNEIRSKFSDLYQIYLDVNNYHIEKQRLEQLLSEQNKNKQLSNYQQVEAIMEGIKTVEHQISHARSQSQALESQIQYIVQSNNKKETYNSDISFQEVSRNYNTAFTEEEFTPRQDFSYFTVSIYLEELVDSQKQFRGLIFQWQLDQNFKNSRQNQVAI